MPAAIRGEAGSWLFILVTTQSVTPVWFARRALSVPLAVLRSGRSPPGEDWISPRLAFIFATDDAPDRPVLSAQETRTLQLYATGLPVKSVARRLGIGEETAKQYVRRVREKYAQANRAAPTKVDLYHRAVEDGHLPLPP